MVIVCPLVPGRAVTPQIHVEYHCSVNLDILTKTGSCFPWSWRNTSARGDLGKLLPVVKVNPPGPKSKAIAKTVEKYESPEGRHVGAIPIAWKRAAGANIVDADGNVYIDTSAAFTVAIAGHSHPKIAEAIGAQARELMHAPAGMSPNEQRARLLEKLAGLLPDDLKKIHLGNIGSEAIDIAIKLAQIHTGRTQFIAFQGGFHGKTHGALSLTSRNYYRQEFLPLLPSATHVPYGYCYRCAFEQEYPACSMLCTRYLDNMLSDPASGVGSVAAVVLEPVQGHEGFIVPPNEFVPNIRKICDKHNVLMVLDEIITGFGRTGKMFCFQYSNMIPDILVCAKGIASGFPISATIARKDIAASWKMLKHTSTFLANPIGCAAGVASLTVIEEEHLVEKSAELGSYLLKRLREFQNRHELIGDVRGKGLMIGVELVSDRETKAPATKVTERIVNEALKRGVYFASGGRYGNVLKISPPLVITKEQIDFALEVLDKALKMAEKKA
jgi:4-aminobutyrate aminotransferase